MLLYEHPSLPRAKAPFTQGRDTWWSEALSGHSSSCAPVWMDAEAPLFLLYTSGSTGKPKGVLHTTGGLLSSCQCAWLRALCSQCTARQQLVGAE